MTKNLLFVLGTLAVAALIVLALWRAQPKPPSPSPTPTPPVAAPEITYGEAGGDWQTYSSAALGFSIRYPADWTTAPCGASCAAWARSDNPTRPIAGVSVIDGSLADLLVKAGPYAIASSTVQFGGLTWTRLSLAIPGTGDVFTSHFTEAAGKVYEFGVNTSNPESLAVYGAMLPTLTILP